MNLSVLPVPLPNAPTAVGDPRMQRRSFPLLIWAVASVGLQLIFVRPRSRLIFEAPAASSYGVNFVVEEKIKKEVLTEESTQELFDIEPFSVKCQ